MDDKLFLLCSCNSLDHLMMFWCDKDDPDFPIYTEVHLTKRNGFFKRLLYALKYTLGYKSGYGCWDEFLFDKENSKQLLDFLIKYNGQIF